MPPSFCLYYFKFANFLVLELILLEISETVGSFQCNYFRVYKFVLTFYRLFWSRSKRQCSLAVLRISCAAVWFFLGRPSHFTLYSPARQHTFHLSEAYSYRDLNIVKKSYPVDICKGLVCQQLIPCKIIRLW